MDKQEELILKIISLSEERMRLLNSNNNDSSLNFEKINKRIHVLVKMDLCQDLQLKKC